MTLDELKNKLIHSESIEYLKNSVKELREMVADGKEELPQLWEEKDYRNFYDMQGEYDDIALCLEFKTQGREVKNL